MQQKKSEIKMPPKRVEKKKKKKCIIDAASLPRLIFNCVMMVLVPYLYLFVCGIIDSSLLSRGYSFREGFILFVFFSLIIFWIIGITLAIASIVKFVKNKKTAGDNIKK